MCAPSPPATPDFSKSAQDQFSANVDAARAQGRINNPNVVSPYGNQTVTWGGPVAETQSNFDSDAYLKANPDVGKAGMDAWTHYSNYGKNDGRGFTAIQGAVGDQPTLTQTFSPQQQALFDQSNATKLQLSKLGGQGAEALQGVVGKAVDFSGAPSAPTDYHSLRNSTIDAMMSRPKEDYARAQDQKHSSLIAAGIRPGTQAYDSQMQLLQRGLNDANTQAAVNAGTLTSQAYQIDQDRRKQAITEQLAQRQIPLNEITALMSGSQVSNPFSTPGYAQNAQIGAAPVFAAQQADSQWAGDMYNAKAKQAGNMQEGLFQLGAAGISAWGGGGGGGKGGTTNNYY
jgi:hypothetical protein